MIQCRPQIIYGNKQYFLVSQVYGLKTDNDQIFVVKWYLEILKGTVSDGIIRRLNNYTAVELIITDLRILITHSYFLPQL